MRSLLWSLLVLALVAIAAPNHAPISLGTTVLTASSMGAEMQAQPDKDLKVDINVNRGSGGGAWYRSPVWIAIMAIGGVVVLLLLVLIARGGGTTVVPR